MKLLRPTLLAPILAIAGAVAACAQVSIKVGGDGVPYNGWATPFGVEQYTSFQELYDHTLFSSLTGPINIGGLTFFALNDIDNGTLLPGTIAPSTYSIQL